MDSEFINKTVKELRELAKEKKIKNYSKMLKADLVKALSDSQPGRTTERVVEVIVSGRQAYTYDQLVKKSVKDLKEIAKELSVKGYYKLNKDSLVSEILNKQQPERSEIQQVIVEPVPVQQQHVYNLKSMKVSELKDLAKSRGVRAYYKLKKDELVRELELLLGEVHVERIEEPVREEIFEVPVMEEVQVVRETPVVSEIIIGEVRREKYIDDILNEIQMPNIDKYLRSTNIKILQCLGMY